MYSWNRCHVKKSEGAMMPSNAPTRTVDLNFGRRMMRSNETEISCGGRESASPAVKAF
jgi:hypothetical protein